MGDESRTLGPSLEEHRGFIVVITLRVMRITRSVMTTIKR